MKTGRSSRSRVTALPLSLAKLFTMAEADRYLWTKSLSNLPKLSYDDVLRIVNQHLRVETSKLRKGYKLFWEKYIFNYIGKCFKSVDTV